MEWHQNADTRPPASTHTVAADSGTLLVVELSGELGVPDEDTIERYRQQFQAMNPGFRIAIFPHGCKVQVASAPGMCVHREDLGDYAYTIVAKTEADLRARLRAHCLDDHMTNEERAKRAEDFDAAYGLETARLKMTPENLSATQRRLLDEERAITDEEFAWVKYRREVVAKNVPFSGANPSWINQAVGPGGTPPPWRMDAAVRYYLEALKRGDPPLEFLHEGKWETLDIDNEESCRRCANAPQSRSLSKDRPSSYGTIRSERDPEVERLTAKYEAKYGPGPPIIAEIVEMEREIAARAAVRHATKSQAEPIIIPGHGPDDVRRGIEERAAQRGAQATMPTALTTALADPSAMEKAGATVLPPSPAGRASLWPDRQGDILDPAGMTVDPSLEGKVKILPDGFVVMALSEEDMEKVRAASQRHAVPFFDQSRPPQPQFVGPPMIAKQVASGWAGDEGDADQSVIVGE